MLEEYGVDWDATLEEFRRFGKHYTQQQLCDFDWCVKELGRLGYAVTIRYVTRAYAKHLFAREPDYPDGVDGVYSYLLWGPRFPEGMLVR